MREWCGSWRNLINTFLFHPPTLQTVLWTSSDWEQLWFRFHHRGSQLTARETICNIQQRLSKSRSQSLAIRVIVYCDVVHHVFDAWLGMETKIDLHTAHDVGKLPFLTIRCQTRHPPFVSYWLLGNGSCRAQFASLIKKPKKKRIDKEGNVQEGTVIFNVHTPFNSTPKKVISIYFVFYGALSCMTLNLLGLWLVQAQQREDLWHNYFYCKIRHLESSIQEHAGK